MTEYRRSRDAQGHSVWHFCRDCRQDPKHNFSVRYVKPRLEDICTRCLTKRVEVQEPAERPFLRLLRNPGVLRPARPLREVFEEVA
jgi:hypothetical protein